MRRRAAWDRQWNLKLRRRRRPRRAPRVRPAPRILMAPRRRVIRAPVPAPHQNVSIVKRGDVTFTTHGQGPTYVSGLDDLDDEIAALEYEAECLAGW